MEEQNEIAEALNNVASALRDLGNGNAATPMGGMEALGLVFKEGMLDMTNALREVAQAIQEHDPG